MKETEPLPCPFCKSSNIRISEHIRFDIKEGIIIEPISVQCIDCGANGPTIMYIEKTIETWNAAPRN